MANRFWVSGSGTWNSTSTANWSATSGGASGASAPTAADVALFNANAGAGTITIGEDVTVFSMTFANSSILTVDWNNKVVNLDGNAASIYVGNAAITMLNNPTINSNYAGATGTRTITAGVGVLEANAINVNILSGTDIVTLGSGNNTYKNVNFTGFAGTLNTGNRVFYGGLIYSALMTLASGSFGGHQFLATSGVYTLTMAGKVFDGLFTFNGAATWEFTDALTIAATRTLTLSNGTLKLKNGVTSTMGAFVSAGANQKFLQSTLAGSQATLSQASGTVSTSNLTIQDINAIGGAKWNAYTTNNNVDGGNNDGWDFSFQLGKYIYTLRKNKRLLS